VGYVLAASLREAFQSAARVIKIGTTIRVRAI